MTVSWRCISIRTALKHLRRLLSMCRYWGSEMEFNDASSLESSVDWILKKWSKLLLRSNIALINALGDDRLRLNSSPKCLIVVCMKVSGLKVLGELIHNIQVITLQYASCFLEAATSSGLVLSIWTMVSP